MNGIIKAYEEKLGKRFGVGVLEPSQYTAAKNLRKEVKATIAALRTETEKSNNLIWRLRVRSLWKQLVELSKVEALLKKELAVFEKVYSDEPDLPLWLMRQ